MSCILQNEAIHVATKLWTGTKLRNVCLPQTQRKTSIGVEAAAIDYAAFSVTLCILQTWFSSANLHCTHALCGGVVTIHSSKTARIANTCRPIIPQEVWTANVFHIFVAMLNTLWPTYYIIQHMSPFSRATFLNVTLTSMYTDVFRYLQILHYDMYFDNNLSWIQKFAAKALGQLNNKLSERRHVTGTASWTLYGTMSYMHTHCALLQRRRSTSCDSSSTLSHATESGTDRGDSDKQQPTYSAETVEAYV